MNNAISAERFSMSNPAVKLISWFRVDLGSDVRNRKLHSSLRELVVILFAVVFGVGLSKLGDPAAKTAFDFILLATVYIAVLQSWWGYNLGVIAGPPESNLLCYFIDVLLLVLYWLMIDNAFDLMWVLRLFVIMFTLYVLWEAIRLGDTRSSRFDRQKVAAALFVNVLFLGFFVAILCVQYFAPQSIRPVFYPIVIVIITFTYRYVVHRVYSNKQKIPVAMPGRANDEVDRLVLLAQKASEQAQPHISGYRVGAAILTSDGEEFTGCNIEFDNYSNTLHAEEVAIGAMVSGGATKPAAIAVYTEGSHLAYPCGMCLQSLFELGGKQLRVIACNEHKSEEKTMAELMPHGFTLERNE